MLLRREKCMRRRMKTKVIRWVDISSGVWLVFVLVSILECLLYVILFVLVIFLVSIAD